MSGINEKALLPVLEEAGFEEYEIKEEFISKRNKVFLLAAKRKTFATIDGGEAEKEIDILAQMGLFETGHDCGHDCSGCHENCEQRANDDTVLIVWKQYEQEDAFYEVSMLRLLRNYKVPVPMVLASSDDGILTEYIAGENLCDLFIQAEKNNDDADDIILLLSGWLKKYYKASAGKSRGDINLRNFIYNTEENKLYGLDFENNAWNTPVYDIGNLLAYIVNYEPAFTHWKCETVKRMATAFIMELNLRTDELCKAYKQALSDLEERRKVKVPEFVFSLLDEEN